MTMDPALRLLARLRDDGVQLTATDQKLMYTAPSNVVSPAVIAELREHKPALLALLALEELRPRDQAERIPASFAQRRFWLLANLNREASFCMRVITTIRGRLDADALDRSLQEIIRRHDILRTTLVDVEGEPQPRVEDGARLAIERSQALGATTEARRSWARQRVTREAQTRIDLTVGPIIRALVVEVDELECIVGLVIHHAAFDGGSLALVQRELRSLYAAFCDGKASPLPELRIHYADYAVYEQAWARSEAAARQLAYWKATLAGVQTLTLPTDRPRPRIKGTSTATVGITLSPLLAERVELLARAERATPSMILQSAFYVVLGIWSNQDDLVLGTIVDVRDRPDLDNLIGPMVNNLALRTSLAGDPSFVELTARVKRTVLDALANQQTPFERVLDAINPPRDPSRAPIVQCAFNFMQRGESGPAVSTEPPVARADAPDAQLGGQWRWDLYLVFTRGPAGQLGGQIEYDTELFDRTTVERMGSHYITVLESVLDDATRPISRVSPLTPPERKQLLVDWNATAAPFPSDRCLHELIEEQVKKTPGASAVSFEDQSWTYDELNRRANRLARWLRAAGVDRNVLVAVYMDRSLEMVVALLAILKAGGAYVPVDPEYPQDRVSYMLRDAGSRVLLTQARFSEALVHDGNVLALDAAWTTLPDDDTDLTSGASPSDLAYMIYTSGSTGQPKGACNAHVGIVNRLWWMQERYRLGSDDRVLQKTPFSFDVSVWEFFWPLLAGAHLVVARPGGHRDPSYLTDLIIQRGITTIHFVPSMLRIFVSEPRSADCHSLRRVICSGEALPPAVADELLERSSAELYNLYGPTEAAVDVTAWHCTRGAASVPIGRPIANIAMYVLDESLEPMPVGLTGELFIGGVGVGLGYHGRPALTAEKFIPDPFSTRPGARLYRTGDHGRFRADSALEFVGRIDGQVKVRGFRIELGEIESALRASSGVEDVVVTVREETSGDKRIVAYVVLASTDAPSTDALKTALRARLPEYMLPNAFVVLPVFPLGPSGKVNRKALPAPNFAAVYADDYVAPRTPLEETIAEVWQSVLDVPRVGVNDDFFRLGGHSLLVMKIVGRLRLALDHDIPVQAVFASSTVAELARRLSGEADALAPPPLTRTDKATGSVLSFSQAVMVAFERDRIHSCTWTTPLGLRLRGALDRVALKEAIRLLLTRQEALLLRVDLDIPADSSGSFAADAIDVRLVDMRGCTEQAVREYCCQRASSPIRGPFIEFDLIERDADDHVLMISYHQLVHDPTAQDILAQELVELYASRVEKREPRLPALEVRYVDFASWQKRWYEEGPGQAEVRSAQQRFGAMRGVELPTDRPRHGHVSPACVTIRFSVDDAHAVRFYELCRSTSVTPFMGFCAITAIFLAGWSGQEDISFMSPVNLRPLLPEVQNLVGRFINFTVISVSLSDDPSLAEVFRRARAATLAGHSHSFVPAPLVLGTPLIFDDPLFRVLLNTPAVNASPARSTSGPTRFDAAGLDVSIDSLPIPSGARNDLAVNLGGSGETVFGSLRGATDLFDSSTIQRKALELASVFRDLSPDLRVSQVRRSNGPQER